jgi:hypothetical protein
MLKAQLEKINRNKMSPITAKRQIELRSKLYPKYKSPAWYEACDLCNGYIDMIINDHAYYGEGAILLLK